MPSSDQKALLGHLDDTEGQLELSRASAHKLSTGFESPPDPLNGPGPISKEVPTAQPHDDDRDDVKFG